MGGGDASGSDGPEQEVKRAAAAAYNYEGDARWAEYWSNVLVPPHLASRPDVVDHFKRKFYQRYIDRDLVVEPMSSTGSPQPSGPEVLKQMYHAPVTASYHQSAWAKIGRIVNPYIHRYAPFLNTPISAAQRWWFR
uniref:Uncharacterized protein n=1 Tax=Oryza punctata TaxID=4537 RepID=A0A0E0L6G5_ORYPU